MKDSLSVFTGSLDDCSRHLALPREDLVRKLEALSELCVARDGAPGLTAAYTAAFLEEQLKLPFSSLGICYDASRSLAGFCFYHLSIDYFPAAVRAFAAGQHGYGRLGYAQAIAVHPDYRGEPWGVYDALIAAVIRESEAHIDTFMALVRKGNEQARKAHLRRGWLESDREMTLAIHGTTYTFECLFFPLRDRP